MIVQERLLSRILILLIISSFFSFSYSRVQNEGGEKDSNNIPNTNAIAIFGYDVKDSHFFTQHITDKLRGEITFGEWSKHHSWDQMTSFSVGGEQFIMGHGAYDEDNNGYKWFIQKLYTSGEIGPETDSDGKSGLWNNRYDKLVSFEVGDRTFIFGQESFNKGNHRWFVQEILPGGKLADKECDSGHWDYFYGSVTPVYLKGKTCLFLHTKSDHNYWMIKHVKLHDDGTVTLHLTEDGHWEHYWQVLSSYRADDHTYIFGHRRRYDWEHVTYRGPWFIQRAHDDCKLGDESDSGEFKRYFATMNIFYVPAYKKFYLVGHNTDKFFFIQHVTFSGEMGTETYHENFSRYYEYFLPFHFNTHYIHTNNWMGRQKSIIGERPLHQIALAGSHDSGMSEAHDCFCGSECNTVTQYGDIYDQLINGARYFDIRPKIKNSSGTDWDAGHIAHKAKTNVGCLGESKSNIVKGLKKFFEDKDHADEVVILKVSHCSEKPGLIKAGSCTDSQIENIANNLAKELDKYLVKGDDCVLWDMTLNEILKKGNIILLFTSIDGNKSKGIFTVGGKDDSKDYRLYDKYSETEHFWTMRNNQVKKLLNHENHKGKTNFLLSWTLTLSTGHAVECDVLNHYSILDLLRKCHWRLFEQINELVEEKKITKTLFPNILYMDGISGSAARTAIYLNENYDSLLD
ncbi:MAG: hypothetical protein PVH88_06325 [Ignavibacteria bacterium]|jgi:hypothetical protein